MPQTKIQLMAIHPFDTKPGDLGVTVRRGSKWHDIVDEYGIGTTCELVQTTTEDREHGITVGHGSLLSAQVMKFKDIPASFIQYEHEESSRLYDGLLASMRRAYGVGFAQTDEVSVVVYRRID